MCGLEKTQTSDNKQQTDQTQPRTGRPPGWMDGGRIPRPPSPCLPSRPVSSRIPTPAGTPSPPTAHNTHRSQRRAFIDGQQTWPPAQAAPAGQPTFPSSSSSPSSPPSPPPSPSRARLRRQRASLIRSDRQIAGGAGPWSRRALHPLHLDTTRRPTGRQRSLAIDQHVTKKGTVRTTPPFFSSLPASLPANRTRQNGYSLPPPPPSSLLPPSRNPPPEMARPATCPIQFTSLQFQFQCYAPLVSRWAHQPAP
jgi:hypothetical protein